MREKKIMSVLMAISGATLSVSLLAKWLAGYIVRGWSRVCKKQDLSVDVIAPSYGPAMVVSTEEFDDSIDSILTDSYHTRTLLRVAHLELARKCMITASLVTLLVTFLFWALGSEE